ncbi:MAG: hypothetical protein AB7P33_08890 [Dehalococcoidia bacterium]
MSIEHQSEPAQEAPPAFPQGASRRRGHTDHAELQAALWLAARSAIINGRRRRLERQAQTAMAEAVASGRRR